MRTMQSIQQKAFLKISKKHIWFDTDTMDLIVQYLFLKIILKFNYQTILFMITFGRLLEVPSCPSSTHCDSTTMCYLRTEMGKELLASRSSQDEVEVETLSHG